MGVIKTKTKNKKNMRIFTKDWMKFSKTVFNHKISASFKSTSLKKIHFKSYNKRVTCLSIKPKMFIAKIQETNSYCFVHNSAFLKLKTQNQNVKSAPKTV